MATNPTPPSSSLPQPLSYDQILGQELSSYASSTGINDQNTSSVNTSFFQLVALMTARTSGDVFQILRDFNLSRATGPSLQNLAIEYGVTPLGAKVATSSVTVVDLSFQKKFTQIYAGLNPPIAGSTTIYVSNASNFPASGSVYLGRGTPNIEGPLPYSAKTQIGSYWSLTLSSPTTKFHNISESVILAQGGVRTVPVNTIVVSPSVGTSATVQYSVSQTSNILDGETTVTNVPITALLSGAAANVPAGSISQFAGNPSGLPNASVTNPSAIFTGADPETDTQLRIRVQNHNASTGLGTTVAIESALQGVQSPTSSDTIVSTDVLRAANNTTVYVDNGGIYEATHAGVPIEAIVNSALGGEKFFQLVTGGKQTSVTKAFLQSVAGQPFNLKGGEHLTVVVGNITYDHIFSSTDFANPGSATAYEVAASLNGDTTLNYEAVTAGNGTFVVIRPEDEVTNRIQVTTPANPQSVDANLFLQFSAQLGETLRLYKNGLLLTEDGSTASIFTQPQSLWSNTLANGETLSLSIDGTAAITYTLTNAEFVAEGTYTTLSSSNSLQSWKNVLNNVVTGITASIVGSTIEITSNLGAVNRAQVTVVNTISNPTSLISKGVISTTDLSSTGVKSDYILDRNTAQIKLASALVAGDTLSAGSTQTQANIKGSTISSGAATLSANGHVWIAIDIDAIIIPTILSGSLLSVSKIGSNTVRYTSSSSSAFSNVVPGDYLIIWSAEIPAGDDLEGRVHAVTASTLDIEVTAAEYAAASPISNAAYVQGFVVVRTKKVPQKFKISSGVSTLDVIAAQLQTQTDELTFGVFENTNITVVTNTDDVSGEITIVTSDANGALIGLISGSNSRSQSSLIAFYGSQGNTSDLPLFFHSPVSADSYANPIDSYLTNFTSTTSVASFDPNEIIQFINPYGGIDDEQPTLENVQMSATSGTSITILPEYPDVRRLRVNDRYFVANPLDFGYNDTVVAIVDNNTVGETYTMQLYRRAIVNNTYPPNNYSFNAYDVDAGATASFSSNFTGFNFSNFKALLQAKYVLSGSNANTSLLYRSSRWGRSGEVVNVSYVYPTAANNPIGSNVVINDSVNVQISLISGNPISSSIAANTQWNVAITSNTPSAGIDQVTYTWANQYTFTVTSANATAGAVYTNNGHSFTVSSTIVAGTTLVTIGSSGQPPTASGVLTKFSGVGDATITFSSFVSSGLGSNPNLILSGGEYVTILPTTNFNVKDTGTFRVSTTGGFTPTSVSFSVPVPTGTAVAQTGVVTGVLNGINFYSATATSANAINTYVNANLSKYFTTTVVNGSGAGIIVLSTYEDSGFTTSSYYLKDGINWIFSSNVTGSPQFTLKKALTYPSAPGYSFFTSGDEVRLIPTTMEQVKDLWNILAVTGFTTVGTIETSDRGTKVQLATNTVGSGGSVEVVGGSGNEYSVPVLSSGQLINNNHMVVLANSIASQSVASDQWFRLSASNFQNKNTGISNNTSVTVLSNTPMSGQSTVTLLNQQYNQLYFGSPRNYTRIQGDTFRIEKQGLLTCLSWTGVGTNPVFTSALNFNDGGGWTVNVTSSGVYTVASGNTNFSQLEVGDIITISGCANSGNNGTFIVQGVALNGLTFSIANPSAVAETGTPITAGEFSSTSSVSEGDTVIITSPFSPLNQGEYRVIRLFNNSVWYENSNSIEEEVSCVTNTIGTGYNATTVFNVTVNGGLETLSWTGTGTSPSLGLALPGDVVTFGSGFTSPYNRGSFMVLESGPTQQQIAQFSLPAGNTFASSGPGDYFEVYNGGNANKYYIWYNVSGGSNTDPAPGGGFVGIQVTINNTDNAVTVANETNSAITTAAPVGLTNTVSGNVVTLTATVAAQTNSPVNVSMPSAFSFTVTQLGQTSFLTVINPAAVTQSGISSVTFSINRPQIQFFPYEVTVPGDKLSVNGIVLGSGNAGNYNILQILSPDTVIISGIISQQYNTNLAGNAISLSVQEGKAYTGYKQVLYVSSQPGSSTFNNIVFNTSAQYEKIDLSASVGLTSLSKLDFSTTITNGIDSYDYDTGLIGQANRVIYGDPRDAITYPGVNASGTDIFIREPLLKAVSVALAIRTNIGVSFPQIVSQIQSSVYGLISSNPLGTSIDLSSIVETVRAIPGVTSVVLTSPTYTVSNDSIILTTGQKAFIPSQINNITVALIGS